MGRDRALADLLRDAIAAYEDRRAAFLELADRFEQSTMRRKPAAGFPVLRDFEVGAATDGVIWKQEFRLMAATLDWSECPAVESVPGKVSGAWTFRNSRTPVRVVFENLEDGMTIEEIIEQYPVSRDEIRAVLEFAARSLDKAPSY